MGVEFRYLTNDLLVMKTTIIGTRVHVFNVLERRTSHTTYMHIEDDQWGIIGTRNLPEILFQKFDRESERLDWILSYTEAVEADCLDLIRLAYPNLGENCQAVHENGGEITAYELEEAVI